MTNYNERLERARAEIREILFSYSDPSGPNLHESTENAMAEITQLFKDLVAEAKPKDYPVCENNPNQSVSSWCNKCWTCGIRNNDDLWDGIEIGIEKFEQNLLKALEEK